METRPILNDDKSMRFPYELYSNMTGFIDILYSDWPDDILQIDETIDNTPTKTV